ncbi:MAG: hypothetical protein IJT44_12685 [Clostridia bacterium]|nr:hypothetical protein [Clostridia bacterium]
MLTWINRIITAVLVPIFMSANSPVFLLQQQMNRPKDLISLSESTVITEPMLITAHRGVNAQAPENSIPSYELATEHGYYSAECDIRLTKDNVWVLSHDPFVSKCFWQVGLVSRTDFASLRSFTYKTGTNFWNYPDMQIPTLDEFLDVFVGSETRPQIEIKSSDYDSLHTVLEAVRSKGLMDKAIIISFDLKQLQIIREQDPDVELWYLVYAITQKKIDEAKALGNCWLSADRKLNSEKMIRSTLSQDVGLSLWTVNSIADAEKLYEMGVRYIETDRLCN